MRQMILDTIKENKALATTFTLSMIGIIALSLHLYFSDRELNKELLRSCQDSIRRNAISENLMRDNITAMQDLQYQLLTDLKNKDGYIYRDVIGQIDDTHDVLSLPETRLSKPKTKQVKSELRTCNENVDAQRATFRKLQIIANDTILEYDGIFEELYPRDPILSARSRK